MKRKELAAKLNGREIGSEISAEECARARDNKLVVIFGASDDLAEIVGSITDEVSLYDGGLIAFLDGELLTKKCDNDDCPHEESMLEKAKIVKAVWCGEGKATWSYESDIPHDKFMIKEDGENYCEGIVISYEDLK